MVDPSDRLKGFINGSHHPDWDWHDLHRVALQEARRVLLDSCSAEDAAQEALIRAIRHARTCRDPERPQPWVRSIARREALRIAGRAVPEASSAPEADVPTGRLVAALDVREAMNQCLSQSDRELLGRRYWAGQTEAEIAADFRMPLGTVKTRLHRARRSLRILLTEPPARIPEPQALEDGS